MLVLAFALLSGADTDRYHTPEVAAGASNYAAAMTCAFEKAKSIAFDSPKANELAAKIVTLCQDERNQAVLSMKNVLNVSDAQAEQNVSAKMRIAADSVLIERLESGEPLKGIGDDPLSINADAAAYISCLRTSLNKKMEGIYLGEDWLSKLRSMPHEVVEQEYLKVGYAACPITRSKYLAKFDRVVSNERDSELREVIQKNFAPSIVEHLAVSTYLAVVPKDG